MTSNDRHGLPEELSVLFQKLMASLADLDDRDRPVRATQLAAAIVEFGAYETALTGQSGTAARLIGIASQLEHLSRDTLPPEALTHQSGRTMMPPLRMVYSSDG